MSTHMHNHPTRHCEVCGQDKPAADTMAAVLVRPNVADIIRKRKPDWTTEGYICNSCLNNFRTDFVREQMEKDRGELSQLESEVVKSIQESQLIAENLNKEFDRNLSFGDRVADQVAAFGGSWKFIGLFTAVLIVWVFINTIILMSRAFDPYPFILLNLFLSMLAAIQAPVIMMSQNRQEERDRLRAENDYQVNLKAELEVRALSEKIDQLLHHQWTRLLEIQQVQMEMLQDLAGKAQK